MRYGVVTFVGDAASGASAIAVERKPSTESHAHASASTSTAIRAIIPVYSESHTTSPLLPQRRPADYYVGSAEAMQRNLEKRVEILCPIEDPRLQAEMRYVLDTQLSDQRGAWDMQPDGSYVQRTGLNAKHSQVQMIERTERRLKEATRLRRRKVQAIARRRR